MEKRAETRETPLQAAQALLRELAADDYVRFKYGRRVDAALKALDGAAPSADRELEERLVELLALVRGKKRQGGGAATPPSKSAAKPRRPKSETPAELATAHP